MCVLFSLGIVFEASAANDTTQEQGFVDACIKKNGKIYAIGDELKFKECKGNNTPIKIKLDNGEEIPVEAEEEIVEVAGIPAPDFNSGWVTMTSPDMIKEITHSLGGDIENYKIEIDFKSYLNKINQDHTKHNVVWWSDLSETAITVNGNGAMTNLCKEVRVRIWVLQ